MSSFARRLLCTAIAAGLCAGSAGAQLAGRMGLPRPDLPPLGALPVAGPVLQNVLDSPEVQQEVVRPTLDSVRGLPETVAESGATTLAQLRRLVPDTLAKGDPAPMRLLLFRIHVDDVSGRAASSSAARAAKRSQRR